MVPVAVNVTWVQVNALDELLTIPPSKTRVLPLEFQGPVVVTKPVTVNEPEVFEKPPLPIVKLPPIVEALPLLLLNTCPLATFKLPEHTRDPLKDIAVVGVNV